RGFTRMLQVNAVIFDFIGTLTELENYPYDGSKEKLYQSLKKNGYNCSSKDFFQEYEQAYQKYREIRYGQLVEISNEVWISDALNKLGYMTTPQNEKIQIAVNAFFEDYLEALKLRKSARSTLQKLHKKYKVGLVSNFTSASAVYSGLKKLGIRSLFDEVLISEAFGWRKPSARIFQEALRKLNAEAEETIFVGDTPIEDIQGAKRVGMRTIFIPSQFKSIVDLKEAEETPDHIIEDLSEIFTILNSTLRED
ncbi:MAG: HAD family hydrolase, partial [Candidatus Bathyarchaeota archaeon]|nr:HAD family hydrolase [Candidatus Bathyarchaeota archaeon]